VSSQPRTAIEGILAETRYVLRTPLNQILGYTDLLLQDRGSLGQPSLAELEGIRENASFILARMQQRLAPGENQAPEARIEALRTDIVEPVDLIVLNASALERNLRGKHRPDVARIKAASLELLNFTGGAQPALPLNPLTPAKTNFESPGPSRILLVDDDEAGCDILLRQLVRAGHDVVCVHSGAAALDLMKQPPDLILLDVVMPGMNGFELLDRLKASDSTSGITVIMMTALDEIESAARCIENGAEDYLLKPIEPVLLRARLHSALERKRFREAEKSRIAELEAFSQSLRRANENLNRFAHAASHDLQEPLRTITTTLQFLAARSGRDLAPEQRQLMDRAVDASLRMSHLITDLLSWSTATSEDRVPMPTASEEALRDALSNLRQAIQESGARINHESLPTIRFDRWALAQVFQNLIGNAIKYRAAKTPIVTVSAFLRDRQWVFAVRDNGMGIEPQYFEMIFEPFRRLHGSSLPGTGLGLAICARVVERFGGRIWVESEPGSGSVFFFSVPRDHDGPEGGL